MTKKEALAKDQRRTANGNRNHVPLKQWRKWSPKARAVFNDVYAFIYENHDIVTHPRAEAAPTAQWKTLSWNAAWIAADAVDDDLPSEVCDATPKGRVVRTRKVKGRLFTDAQIRKAVKASCSCPPRIAALKAGRSPAMAWWSRKVQG